ncbi:UNVERIFIED_CONTAM: hypothetical protein Sangu_1484900 [Sesamum angustifolium]|uniref:Uncharacterized protein n=1 Tax=Sesamum angustifolium TaxID=2727405 RepID=A0AAW2MNR9_9LAMI
MSSYKKPVESREAEVRRAEEGSRVEIGHHTDRTKWTEGASGKMLYARTANGQDTLPENVQMWLSATTAGFLGTLLQSVPPKRCVGTARKLGISPVSATRGANEPSSSRARLKI